jgi:DNA repair protein RadC
MLDIRLADHIVIGRANYKSIFSQMAQKWV